MEILCKNEIYTTNVINTNDGYVALLPNDEYAEHIFLKEIKEELLKYDFQALMPPELKVKKSVIARRIDDLIYERSKEDIISELITNNGWIDEEIDVIKFPNSNTLKITFNQTVQARKCREKCLLAFNLSITPHDIKQETYIYITCCMKCYALESHTTSECRKGKEYKVCSKCSQDGNVCHECQEKEKTHKLQR